MRFTIGKSLLVAGALTSALVAIPQVASASTPVRPAAAHPSVFTWGLGGAAEAPGNGWELDSPDGSHRAIFQSDGNWVVYHGATSTWSTKTNGIGIGLVFTSSQGGVDDYGNIYVSRNGGTAWTNKVTGKSSYRYMRMIMQNDGNFVEYAGQTSGPAVWASNTAGK